MLEPTDRQLIIDMQRGKREAMEFFFHRFSPYLYAVCLRYLSEPETSQDLLHDAFVKIFTSISTFKIEKRQSDEALHRSIKSWAARLTANLALNYLRQNAHLQTVPIEDYNSNNSKSLDIPDPGTEDIDVDVNTLSVESLERLIQELPPNYRTVFNLFAIEGFSHREISKMLGISESVSATQYHRAKASLKTKIKKYLDTH